MVRTLRHFRYKAAAFVALSALGPAVAFAQENTETVPVHAAFDADPAVTPVTSAPAETTPPALQPWQELARARIAAEEADLPPPDPCAFSMSPALRSMRGCVGNVTQAPDLTNTRIPLLDELMAQPSGRIFGAAPAAGSDISQLVDPQAAPYDGPGLPRSDDVIIVTGRLIRDDNSINAAYLADLEARFGGDNSTYRQFEDFLASGVGRTTTALGLGLFQNLIEKEVRDGIADLVVGGAESGTDFSMDPIGDRNDAWFREFALRQRGIDPYAPTRR